MRLARIETPDGPREVVGDGDAWAVVEDIFARPLVRTGQTFPVEGARLLAPVTPTVVLGMAHNTGPADRQLPAQAFMKSARTVVGPGDPIVVDARRGTVMGEAELTLVVRKLCRNVSAEDVADVVLGWTVGNDCGAVQQTALDEKMTQTKNGDGFTPIGPWIETDLDPLNEAITAGVRGGEQIGASSAGLAWNPFEVLAYLTSHMTLGPGDIVLTGSPNTAFTVVPGDVSEVGLASVGVLSNPVVALDLDA